MTDSASVVEQIVAAIRAVVGPGVAALHEPRFVGNEASYLQECLDSTFVSSVGGFVNRFEAELAAFTGAAHAVAVVNGTAALHVALQLAGVRRDDEVLLPALTFVATANAAAYCGAVPHFVDCEPRTLGVDPRALRDHLRAVAEVRDGQCVNRATGRVIRALIAVHAFGHPADVDGLVALSRDYRLELVEDAAESLGSTTGGRHTGTFGRIGTLSFNGNKIITAGGGGAILTNDARLAGRAKHLTTTARLTHQWAFVHDEVGYNYRLPNINAALGCAQLERLPALIEAKRALADCYRAAFAGIPQAGIVVEPPNCRSNYWLQNLLLDDVIAHEKESVLAATNAAGLMTRPAWTLLHRLAPYVACPRMALPVSESIERRLISLPSSAHLASAAQGC